MYKLRLALTHIVPVTERSVNIELSLLQIQSSHQMAAGQTDKWLTEGKNDSSQETYQQMCDASLWVSQCALHRARYSPAEKWHHSGNQRIFRVRGNLEWALRILFLSEDFTLPHFTECGKALLINDTKSPLVAIFVYRV